MTGLEPATPCSQSKRPTNWATSVYNGDSDGNRTHDLQRDRLAFYTTELRSHILVGRAGLEPAMSIRAGFTVRCDTNYALPTHMVTVERVELSLRD